MKVYIAGHECSDGFTAEAVFIDLKSAELFLALAQKMHTYMIIKDYEVFTITNNSEGKSPCVP